MTESRRTRHLDLGCGARPRNPYGRDELHGVDIAPGEGKGCELRRANLALEPIPYPDDSFDSLSAFDFLEHVPRVLPTADGRGTRFPFVELMNEVWRVLRNDGVFYASTPCYPHPHAFSDPTHVNALTKEAHGYFTQPGLSARIYGFHGNFRVRRVLAYSPSSRLDYEPADFSGLGLKQRLSAWNRRRASKQSHVLWEFVAVK